MAVKISGTTGIDLGGTSVKNTSAVNNIAVPNETGSFITTFREDNHISALAATHLLQGDVTVTDETSVVGFSSTLYNGTGVLQNINANVDLDTQWGNDPSKRYGGLVICKSRSIVGNWLMGDTVRGVNSSLYMNLTNTQAADNGITGFNNTGFSLSTNLNANTNAATNLAIVFQTTHRKTTTSNHGKTIEEHYNPYTGFFIIKYTGSGVSGHKIAHSLGKKISFAMWKNIGSTDSWVYEGDTLGSGMYFFMPTTTPILGNGAKIQFKQDAVLFNTNTSDTNALSNTYIMYGFADATVDSSNKINGIFETGIYTGNGVNNNNIIKTKNKPAFILTRGLDNPTSNDMVIIDNLRGNKRLLVNTTEAENATATMNIVNNGFNPIVTTGINNVAGTRYIYLVVYDNDDGSGRSKYTKTSDTSLPRVNNALALVQNGLDSNGKKNSILTKDEALNLVLKPGNNYIYYTKAGNSGSTIYPPNVDTYNGFGEYLDSDTNKWYQPLSVFADDFSNGLGTWKADEFSGGTPAGALSIVNGELKIANTGASNGAARNTFPTVIGKRYKLTISLKSINVSNFNVTVGSAIRTGDLGSLAAVIQSTMTSAADDMVMEFIAKSTTTHIMIYNNNVASAISTWDNISVYPINVDGSPDISNAIEITEGRTYLNNVLVCDHNSKIVGDIQLPKTVYLNSTKINNLESVKGNAVTSSVTDNTPGKLMRVGDFGIGGKALYIPAMDLNNCIKSGSYVVGPDCLNVPITVSGWVQVYENNAGSAVLQIFTSGVAAGGTKNRVFVRNFVNSNYYSPWQEQASYETGTWTPEVTGGITNGTSAYSYRSGTYTKINNVVHFQCYIQANSVTGTGGTVIRGLPYPITEYGACTLNYLDNLTFAGIPTGYLVPGSQYIILQTNTSNTNSSQIPIDSAFGIMISGTYKA